jgi:hypothetical protein
MTAIVRTRRQTTQEKRRFKAHDQLLVSVIKRQAGSLWKAVIEGVMNAVDAGATKCDIDLSPQQLNIKDNGKGFKSKKEIEDFFETFGQPHEDAEDKVFGQFRMGRGQLFAYGRNLWRTGTFEMTVDINKDGLDYHLIDGLSQEDGCAIAVELYEPLTHTAYAEMLAELEQNCKYVSFECNVNGRQINKLPSTQTWDMETEEADIRFRQNGSMIIYNQGIRVCEWPRQRLGTGGEVVTKKNLTVNFARNDIMSNCPVWAKIQAAIFGHSNARAIILPQAPGTTPTTRRQRAPRLTEKDRVRLVNQAKDGLLTAAQLSSAKLFLPMHSTVNLSLGQIYSRYCGNITFPPVSDHPNWYHRDDARVIAEHKLAAPLSRATLARWGISTHKNFVSTINALSSWYTITYVPWNTLETQITEQKSILLDKDLTRVEAIVLATLRKFATMTWGFQPANVASRQIHIGAARQGDSWTDGDKWIALSRTLVARNGCGPSAWITYALLIAHEYAHTTPTLKRHAHSAAFYKRFHESVTSNRRTIARLAARCTAESPMIAETINRRMTRTELAALYRREAAARRLAAISAIGTARVAPPPEAEE